MKNLYDAADANEIKERIALLKPESTREWGRMNAAQAVAHCAASMEWAVGDRVPPRAFFLSLMGRLIKPMVLKDDKPFRRNSPTSPDLLVPDQRDLDVERERLIALIDRFVAAGLAGCTTHPHSFFGRMTPNEWAILMYKHLDHHLRQFGV
ncbi:MAG: DUF1569 domain-containing protein [Terracidiphilus sp.]|jgi:hypothetical protein